MIGQTQTCTVHAYTDCHINISLPCKQLRKYKPDSQAV